MVRKIVVFGSLLALLTVPTQVFAQLQTGSILIKAVDEQSSTVPGATVTLKGSVLPW